MSTGEFSRGGWTGRPTSGAPELDHRWEWFPVRQLCQAEPIMLRGVCRHLEVVDVTSVVDGELLARLCVTCDRQFEVDP